MKKLFLILILWPSLVFASPFLVSDPNPDAEKIILEINGVETLEFAAEADGSIRYDLAGLPDGGYAVRAKAGNVWGWSEWSHTVDDPFVFTKAIPEAHGGLRVSSE